MILYFMICLVLFGVNVMINVLRYYFLVIYGILGLEFYENVSFCFFVWNDIYRCYFGYKFILKFLFNC